MEPVYIKDGCQGSAAYQACGKAVEQKNAPTHQEIRTRTPTRVEASVLLTPVSICVLRVHTCRNV